jgi:hypothetical protein
MNQLLKYIQNKEFARAKAWMLDNREQLEEIIDALLMCIDKRESVMSLLARDERLESTDFIHYLEKTKGNCDGIVRAEWLVHDGQGHSEGVIPVAEIDYLELLPSGFKDSTVTYTWRLSKTDLGKYCIAFSGTDPLHNPYGEFFEGCSVNEAAKLAYEWIIGTLKALKEAQKDPEWTVDDDMGSIEAGWISECSDHKPDVSAAGSKPTKEILAILFSKTEVMPFYGGGKCDRFEGDAILLNENNIDCLSSLITGDIFIIKDALKKLPN